MNAWGWVAVGAAVVFAALVIVETVRRTPMYPEHPGRGDPSTLNGWAEYVLDNELRQLIEDETRGNK